MHSFVRSSMDRVVEGLAWAEQLLGKLEVNITNTLKELEQAVFEGYSEAYSNIIRKELNRFVEEKIIALQILYCSPSRLLQEVQFYAAHLFDTCQGSRSKRCHVLCSHTDGTS